MSSVGESRMKVAWMTVRWLAALSLLQFAAAATAQQAPAPTGKFGFVNTERILREATPAVRAQRKIEAEFKKRDDELARTAEQLKRLQEDIDKNGVTMGDAQRRTKEREFGELNREFQRKQREFREDLNQRRNEELAQVIEHAQRVIRQIAEQEKYDNIFQDVVYFSPRIDITEKVIKALDAANKPPSK
jgi:outer membrane protein